MDTAEGKLVVVAAESREFSGIERRLHDVRPLAWPVDYARSGEGFGRRWVLVANGPGPRLAAEAVRVALRHVTAQAVVSTGFCGGLDPALEPCDIFVADRVLADAGECCDVPGALRPAGPRHVGTLFSGDRVVGTLPEKAALFQATGAAAVDMEASSVARLSAEAGLPFYCIRVVTDTAREDFPVDFNRTRDAAGRFSRGRIAIEALADPVRRVPGLMRLERRTRVAAERLGEFLAHAF